MASEPKDLFRRFKRDGGNRKAEIAEGMPVADSQLLTVTTVLMLASVGGKNEDGSRWELVGGTTRQVSPALADWLIINGWATGVLSREYSDGEKEAMRADAQHIHFKSLPPSTPGD